jgi:CRP-like cAMP-binding protein
MQNLKSYISKLAKLDDNDWQALRALFSESSLAKNEFFAREGRHEQYIGFMISGVVRAFYRNEKGIEYNKTFFRENEFIGPYAALVSGTVNKINVQALTDCQILIAPYAGIAALFNKHRNIETLARRIAEILYIEKEKREIELALLQADERYRLFQTEYPCIENLIPQYHIASYLGITPTQLSRIRARK